MASFSPTSAFSSVDLPALGRPMIETNPERKAMSAELWFGVLSLHVFVADRGVSPAESRLRSSGQAGHRPKGPLSLLLPAWVAAHTDQKARSLPYAPTCLGCRLTRTRSTRRSVDSRTSKRRPF